MKTEIPELNLICNKPPGIIYIAIPADFRTVFISSNVQSILGCSPEEITRDPDTFFSLLNKQDRDRIGLELTNILASEDVQYFLEYRIQHKSTGETHWFYDHGLIERDLQGHATRVYGYMMDITHQKQTESAFLEDHIFTQSLIDTAQTIILVLDTEGRIIQFNPYTETLVGYSLDEMKGKNWIATFVPENEQENINKLFRQSIDGERTRGFINTILTKKGEVKYIEWYDKDLSSHNGSITGLLAIGHDITERKLAEDALRENEEKYRILVDNQTDLLVKVDIEGKFQYVSPSYCRIFGKSEEELLGHAFMPLVHEDDRHSTAKAMEALYKPPYHAYMEQRAMTREGWRWFGWMDSVIFDENAKLSSILGVGRDITERKQAEKKLLEANLLLEKEKQRANEMAHHAKTASQAKSSFLANMSHEIRTPLHGVTGLIQLLSRKNLNPENKEIVAKLSASAQLLQQLIDDILDLAKIESGKFKLEYSSFEPEKLLNNCLLACENQLFEKGLQLSSSVNQSVPKVMIGDANRLSQVLLNLLNNALKFTESGTITVAMDYIEVARNNTLLLSVTDTGIGISKDQQQKIFNNFIQLDNSATRQYGGTGLGLSICKHLMDLMGGTISIKSELGEGSTFYCQIPMQKVNKTTAATEKKHIHAINRQMHILVVDDDEINRYAIRGLLESEGIGVVLADSGRKALEIAEQQSFDLILMDLHMPELNGWDTALLFRASPLPRLSKIPIIGVTADVLKESRESCLNVGMNAVVSKPFKFADLLQQIQELE